MTGIKLRTLSDLPITSIYFQKYKRNTLVSKLLSVRGKFMPEMHLTNPGLTYSACWPFKNKKGNQTSSWFKIHLSKRIR